MGISLGQAIGLTVARKKLKGKRPSYVSGLGQYLRLFGKGRESVRVSAITPLAIEDWFASRGEAPSTQNSNLGRLSALFDYCWRSGHIQENPCKKVEPACVEQKAPKILTPHQSATLLEFTRTEHPRALAYLTLCLFVGLRPQEALRMKWECVDLAGKIIRVDAAASKVRRRRLVHLQPAAVAWLRAASQDGLPIGLRQVRAWRRGARAVLGFSAWPHDLLRHTCASALLALFRDAGKIAFELGNSPKVLMSAYSEIVSQEDSILFWAILPPVSSPQLEFPL